MNYTLWQRFKVSLVGRCYLRYEQRATWKKPLPIYLAKCEKHGYYEDFPHGHSGYLACPKCVARATAMLEALRIVEGVCS